MLKDIYQLLMRSRKWDEIITRGRADDSASFWIKHSSFEILQLRAGNGEGHHVVRFVEWKVGLYNSTCSSNPASGSNEPLKHMQLQFTAKELFRLRYLRGKSKELPIVGSFFMRETNSVRLCLQPVDRSKFTPCSSAQTVQPVS